MWLVASISDTADTEYIADHKSSLGQCWSSYSSGPLKFFSSSKAGCIRQSWHLLTVLVWRALWQWTPVSAPLRNHSLQMNVSEYFPDPIEGHCNDHAPQNAGTCRHSKRLLEWGNERRVVSSVPETCSWKVKERYPGVRKEGKKEKKESERERKKRGKKEKERKKDSTGTYRISLLHLYFSASGSERDLKVGWDVGARGRK